MVQIQGLGARGAPVGWVEGVTTRVSGNGLPNTSNVYISTPLPMVDRTVLRKHDPVRAAAAQPVLYGDCGGHQRVDMHLARRIWKLNVWTWEKERIAAGSCLCESL